MLIFKSENESFEFTADVLIVGAGACGMCAALAASDMDAFTVVLEKTGTPLGTTAMSTGLIPAAGHPDQLAENISDTAETFVDDILTYNGGEADREVVKALCAESSDTVTWLQAKHSVPLTLVDGFLYPGHSHRRMFGTPHRTGSELMAALEAAVEDSDAEIVTNAYVRSLYVDKDRYVRGVAYERPDGSVDKIGCKNLILANCGFSGSVELIDKYIPEMSGATLHTHTENRGEAVLWGEELGAELTDMGAYQGHAGLAAGHGVPILWPTIMQGGFQINQHGLRFSNEAKGYSQQAKIVLSQPSQVAWTIFDQVIYDMMLQFDDFNDAIKAGCIVQAQDMDELAKTIKVPEKELGQTFTALETLKREKGKDDFGRDFASVPNLLPPFYAVKVTGALFHTQGGLGITDRGQVLHQDKTPFPNLFAGGGAARGISGTGADGYMAGNGLLTATSLGKICGREAAKSAFK